MSDGFDLSTLSNLFSTATGVVGAVSAPGAAPYLVIQTPIGSTVINLADALASTTGQGQSTIFGLPVTYSLGYGVPPPQTLTRNLLIFGGIALGALLILK